MEIEIADIASTANVADGAKEEIRKKVKNVQKVISVRKRKLGRAMSKMEKKIATAPFVRK
jgi:hypothetical protein